MAAAEKIVKRPPAGRRPSEKKADREKVAAAKAKIESMKLSIQQLADGAEVLEAASTEATAEACSDAKDEAQELMAHSSNDAARIGELEAQVASLQRANDALLATAEEEGETADEPEPEPEPKVAAAGKPAAKPAAKPTIPAITKRGRETPFSPRWK